MFNVSLGFAAWPCQECLMFNTPSVISSVVERSALPLGLSKKSHEISPCALLSRDDKDRSWQPRHLWVVEIVCVCYPDSLCAAFG